MKALKQAQKMYSSLVTSMSPTAGMLVVKIAFNISGPALAGIGSEGPSDPNFMEKDPPTVAPIPTVV